jgi:O-antigen/teichoic acid export membrane protein
VTEATVTTEPMPAPGSAPVPTGDASMKKAYGKTAKVGAMWHIGRESVTQVMGIPTTVILARLLSPADFGIAAAATFFIQLGKRLGNMGLNTALVRMKDVREEHRASVFVINITVGLVTWGTLMLLAPQIGTYYGDPRVTGAVRVASTIFLVNFLGAVEQAVLQREMRFKEMAFVEWTIPAVFMPVSVGMAWAGYGYWSLVIGQVAANSASTFAKVYFGRWRPSFKVTRIGLAETLPFGMGVYAKRLLTYAAENLDSLIVGGMFGVTGLGFYDKAFNAADNLSNRLSLGSTVMFRIFAIIHEERDRFVRAYAKVVLAGTIVTLPVFAGLIVAAPEFISVVFGEKWLPAVVPFQLLCAAGALRLISGYASSAIQAKGRIWGEVTRKLLQVVLIVTLILVLSPWGIQGAALGVFSATLVLTISMQGLVRRVVGLSWRELLMPLAPSALAAVGAASMVGLGEMLVKRATPAAADWQVLLAQIASAGVFWIAFVLFARFGALQDVVDEVLNDLAPGAMRSTIDRVRRRSPLPGSRADALRDGGDR